jgi:hypothetical protein
MNQPVLNSTQFLDMVKREEENIADFKRRSDPLGGHIRWEIVTKDNDPSLHTFFPSNPAPVLFRGQTSVYEPCIATIYRGLPFDWKAYTDSDLLHLLVSHARVNWFVEHLRHHPFGRWAVSQRIDINTLAIAQHYGLPTHYIDLTESPAVGGFFAACDIFKGPFPGAVDCRPSSKKTGILYRVRWHNLHFASCRPIGLQPFPRPKEQWAWTYELWYGEDFQSPRCEQQPCVESLLFEHNTALADYFLDRFDGGRDLFPADVMAEIADQIKNSQFLPTDMLRIVHRSASIDADWKERIPPFDNVIELLQTSLKLEIKDGRQILFTDEQKQRLAAQPIRM